MNIKNLSGKKGLIIGLANESSIAYGCLNALYENGCTNIIGTYQSPKSLQYVKTACDKLGNIDLVEFNYTDENSMEKLFEYVRNQFGNIDFVIHSMAFADKDSLHGKVVDCSAEGFISSMHVSCYSLISCCRNAQKIMNNGGSIITMSYIGAERVIKNYGIMGPIKACLESSVAYLAAELAEYNIRVYAISAGPIATRAAGGIADFDELIKQAELNSPMKRIVTNDEVGNLSAFLISNLSSGMTGQVIYVDAGYFLMG
jgi:enoyl-[acyl-carrier protein] reductase I